MLANESRKCLPGPPAPEPRKVSKKSRAQSEKTISTLSGVLSDCSRDLLETFRGSGAGGPGDIFETFSAFRARETSVRGGLVRKSMLVLEGICVEVFKNNQTETKKNLLRQKSLKRLLGEASLKHDYWARSLPAHRGWRGFSWHVLRTFFGGSLRGVCLRGAWIRLKFRRWEFPDNPYHLNWGGMEVHPLNSGGMGCQENTIKQGALDSPPPKLRGWSSTPLIKGVWVVRGFRR